MSIERAPEANAPISYDIIEACQKSGIGRSTLFGEINAGRLKARKVGRRTLILREDLAAWAAALPVREVETRSRAA